MKILTDTAETASCLIYPSLLSWLLAESPSHVAQQYTYLQEYISWFGSCHSDTVLAKQSVFHRSSSLSALFPPAFGVDQRLHPCCGLKEAVRCESPVKDNEQKKDPEILVMNSHVAISGMPTYRLPGRRGGSMFFIKPLYLDP